MGREGIRVFWEDHMILREYGGRGWGGESVANRVLRG